MNIKYSFVTLVGIIILVCLSCSKEKDDPCKNISANECSGLMGIEPVILHNIYSQNVILDVSINPNNSNEIVFVGQPSGFDEKALFFMNVETNNLQRIGIAFDNYRHIPDWGAGNLILYPLRNNVILPDGRNAGTISGCPSQIGTYPKWCQNGRKVVGVRYDLSEPKTFVADLDNQTVENYDNFGEPFEITEDGSKMVASDLLASSIYWVDLSSNTRHTIPCENQTVRSCDWLNDNETIVWVAQGYEENECGVKLLVSTVKMTNVATNETQVLAKGCFWDQYVYVKASSDGHWLYVLKNHLQDQGEGNFLNKIDLWRIDIRQRIEEYVIG